MHSRLRLVLVVLVACLAGAPVARAAEAPDDGPGFALDAVGWTSYFHYRPSPGVRVHGTVRLVNRSTRDVTVLLRAADATTAASGGLEYGSAAPAGDGRWLTLDRRRVRLPGSGSRTVGFRADVPPTATPGDHLAGIVALDASDVRAARRPSRRGSVQLRFLPRLAVAVQMTLPGGRTRALAIGTAGIDVTPSATDATVLLRSVGDRLIRGVSGELALRQGDEVLVRRRVDLGSFVPGTQITLRTPFAGLPARGRYRVQGTLHPRGGRALVVDEEVTFGAPAARALRRETGRQAAGGGVSMLVVVVGGAALVLVIASLAMMLLRQRRLLATS